MKVLVYGVYAIELAQAILLARLVYLDFAASFGDIHALNMIPAIFWFGVPILTAIGIHPLFWPLVVRCLLESKSVAVMHQQILGLLWGSTVALHRYCSDP